MIQMKAILIGLVIISILVLMGCDEIDVSKLTKDDINKIIVCDTPYIRYASECCLDQDNNSICDRDEAVSEEEDEELSCSDECSIDVCEDKDYISCLNKEDGCRDEVNKGKIIDKCGVECINDDDCSSDEECENYKCEINQEDDETDEETCIDECFDTSCAESDFIDCVSKSDGCRDEVNKGEVVGKCGIDCYINSDCSIDKKCEEYKCVEIIRTKLELENYEIAINILNSSQMSPTHQLVINTCGTFTIDMDTDEYFVVTKIDGETGESAVLQLTKVHQTNGVTIKDYTGTIIAENKKAGKTFGVADMTITVTDFNQSESSATFTISDSLCANNMIITKDGEKIDIPFE